MASPSQSMTSMSHVHAQLTSLEKLDLLRMVFTGVSVALVKTLLDSIKTRAFSKKSFGRKFFVHISKILGGMPLQYGRAIQSPTGITIAKLCHENNISHQIAEIDPGNYPKALIHFIDCKPDDTGKIILYFHGGGYIQPMTSSHFKLARLAAERAHSQLAFLEYTLAPELKYPGQLAQAAEALRYLCKWRPISSIIIGGDSAGGNLTLAVLAHLQKPHPQIPPVQSSSKPDQKLHAAICISPRCSNDCTAPSFKTNAAKDIIGDQSVELFTSNWQPAFDEVWATPIVGDTAFWRNAPASQILLLAGSDEVYVDDIQRQSALMGANEASSNCKFVICPGEIHVQCGLDMVMGVKDGFMMNSLLEFVESL